MGFVEKEVKQKQVKMNQTKAKIESPFKQKETKLRTMKSGKTGKLNNKGKTSKVQKLSQKTTDGKNLFTYVLAFFVIAGVGFAGYKVYRSIQE